MSEKQIELQIDIDDVRQILSERDIQILQQKTIIRNLKTQVDDLQAENEMLKKDIEKLQKSKLKEIK